MRLGYQLKMENYNKVNIASLTSQDENISVKIIVPAIEEGIVEHWKSYQNVKIKRKWIDDKINEDLPADAISKFEDSEDIKEDDQIAELESIIEQNHDIEEYSIQFKIIVKKRNSKRFFEFNFDINIDSLDLKEISLHQEDEGEVFKIDDFRSKTFFKKIRNKFNVDDNQMFKFRYLLLETGFEVDKICYKEFFNKLCESI